MALFGRLVGGGGRRLGSLAFRRLLGGRGSSFRAPCAGSAEGGAGGGAAGGSATIPPTYPSMHV